MQRMGPARQRHGCSQAVDRAPVRMGIANDAGSEKKGRRRRGGDLHRRRWPWTPGACLANDMGLGKGAATRMSRTLARRPRKNRGPAEGSAAARAAGEPLSERLVLVMTWSPAPGWQLGVGRGPEVVVPTRSARSRGRDGGAGHAGHALAQLVAERAPAVSGQRRGPPTLARWRRGSGRRVCAREARLVRDRSGGRRVTARGHGLAR
jgi:hypothetical protein